MSEKGPETQVYDITEDLLPKGYTPGKYAINPERRKDLQTIRAAARRDGLRGLNRTEISIIHGRFPRDPRDVPSSFVELGQELKESVSLVRRTYRQIIQKLQSQRA